MGHSQKKESVYEDMLLFFMFNTHVSSYILIVFMLALTHYIFNWPYNMQNVFLEKHVTGNIVPFKHLKYCYICFFLLKIIFIYNKTHELT